jgi:RimJ/RimL family protein N-acetyltransferase
MDGIILRHLRASDYPEVKKFLTDPAVCKWLTWAMYTEESAIEKYFQESMMKTGYPDEVLAIENVGRFIGTAHLILREQKYVQIGFNVFPAEQTAQLGQCILSKVIDHIKRDWPSVSEAWLDSHVHNDFLLDSMIGSSFVKTNKQVGENRLRHTANL